MRFQDGICRKFGADEGWRFEARHRGRKWRDNSAASGCVSIDRLTTAVNRDTSVEIVGHCAQVRVRNGLIVLVLVARDCEPHPRR